MQGAGSMQGMLTLAPGGAGAAAAGTGGASSTGLAGLLDRLADDLTFTLDRKAETEQGGCAIELINFEADFGWCLPVQGFLLPPSHFVQPPFLSAT